MSVRSAFLIGSDSACCWIPFVEARRFDVGLTVPTRALSAATRFRLSAALWGFQRYDAAMYLFDDRHLEPLLGAGDGHIYTCVRAKAEVERLTDIGTELIWAVYECVQPAHGTQGPRFQVSYWLAERDGDGALATTHYTPHAFHTRVQYLRMRWSPTLVLLRPYNDTFHMSTDNTTRVEEHFHSDLSLAWQRLPLQDFRRALLHQHEREGRLLTQLHRVQEVIGGRAVRAPSNIIDLELSSSHRNRSRSRSRSPPPVRDRRQ